MMDCHFCVVDKGYSAKEEATLESKVSPSVESMKGSFPCSTTASALKTTFQAIETSISKSTWRSLLSHFISQTGRIEKIKKNKGAGGGVRVG